MKDIYALEVERLQAIPDDEFKQKVSEAWLLEENHSPLFDMLGRRWEEDETGISAGCLTQIKMFPRRRAAFVNGKVHTEFTQKIKEDSRIPDSAVFITKESLPVFAEYQREYQALKS